MTNKNKTKTYSNYKSGVNGFFECVEDYNRFMTMVRNAAFENALPLAFQHTTPNRVSLEDMAEFSKMFKSETGLDIEFKVFTCDDCGELHIVMIIDYKE